MEDVIVIGGGASGLVAAISCASQNKKVTILEQNNKLGKKLLVTGNGRCNITNLNQEPGVYRSSSPLFPMAALELFSVQDNLRFLSELGLFTTNINGYIYPKSQQSKSLLQLLILKAKSLGVKIKTNQKVLGATKTEKGFIVEVEGWNYRCNKLILANGSKAYKLEGSCESGYEMAKAFGHNIIKPLPALVPLVCEGDFFQKWEGVRADGELTLYVNGQRRLLTKGQLQLTKYGISGIPTMEISRFAVLALSKKEKVTLHINFMEGFDEEGLRGYLDFIKEKSPYLSDKEILCGALNDKLVDAIYKDDLKNIVDLELKVKDSLGFDFAQVCQGGVDTKEINPDTMESILIKNLYFAGELIDVDGTCGGYNLQWAFTSGYLAGRNAGND